MSPHTVSGPAPRAYTNLEPERAPADAALAKLRKSRRSVPQLKAACESNHGYDIRTNRLSPKLKIFRPKQRPKWTIKTHKTQRNRLYIKLCGIMRLYQVHQSQHIPTILYTALKALFCIKPDKLRPNRTLTSGMLPAWLQSASTSK